MAHIGSSRAQKISEENVKTLVDLGLNYSQAKIYLSLLKLGVATVHDIAKLSNVARPDSYRTVTALLELGLVEKVVENPVRYRPLPLVNAVHLLIRRKTDENTKLYGKARELVDSFAVNSLVSLPYSPENGLILVPSGEATRTKTFRLLESSQKIIQVVAPMEELFCWVREYYDLLVAAIKRNILIEIYSEEIDKLVPSIEEIVSLQASKQFRLDLVTLRITVFLVLVDNKECLLSTLVSPENINNHYCIWSNNPGLIELAKTYIESYRVKMGK